MTSPFHHFDRDFVPLLSAALDKLDQGFVHLPHSTTHYDRAAVEKVLSQVAERLQDNYPYFHPLYAGQMLKPPHPIARLAYALATWINPNNHAFDGGRASSHMEKEAVARIAHMVQWASHLGHLCSGGTMANLEALWVAGKLSPGKTVLASAQAHYTHSRISGVLGLQFDTIKCRANGAMDLEDLRCHLDSGNVGTVVATMGTTALGAVDPLPEILRLRDRYGFRVHADAAYGGFFRLASNLQSETQQKFVALDAVDSLVIDPHKHGLQPYGCGCVLFRDPAVGQLYKHDSPYTYFSSAELHLGEISLECSRPGAAAVALWATQELLPLTLNGEFARSMDQCRDAAVQLHHLIQNDPRFLPIVEPELDIVVWAPRAKTVSAASAHSRTIFENSARRGLHLALAHVPVEFLNPAAAQVMTVDQSTILCLRSVLMKSEHSEWIDRIWQILDSATRESL